MAALAATASAGQAAGAGCCAGPGARLGSAQSWRLCRLFVPLPASPLGRTTWRPPPSPLGVRGLQTFLPFPDFAASVRSLDNRRLGKQRVEAFQILKVITGEAKSNAWKNSPVVRMWRGYADALALYYNECLREWSSRGFRNVILEPVPVPVAESAEMPAWFGDEELHASHRSNLLRKDPEFYGQYRWPEAADKPYVWPVPLSPPEQATIAASADDDTAVARLVSATLVAAAAVKPLRSEVAKASGSKSSPSTRSKRRMSSSITNAADNDKLQEGTAVDTVAARLASSTLAAAAAVSRPRLRMAEGRSSGPKSLALPLEPSRQQSTSPATQLESNAVAPAARSQVSDTSHDFSSSRRQSSSRAMLGAPVRPESIVAADGDASQLLNASGQCPIL
eukprot:SM000023S07548  [mRNA]  locus=s23:57582:59313:- [translate_table: standard]